MMIWLNFVENNYQLNFFKNTLFKITHSSPSWAGRIYKTLQGCVCLPAYRTACDKADAGAKDHADDF